MAYLTELEAGAGSLAEFYDWLHRARAGETIVYHVGDLQYDRQVEVDPTDPEAHSLGLQRMALNAVADAVLRASRDKTVTLTQKRLGPGRYEYRATRVRQGQSPLPQRKRFTRDHVDTVLS